MTPYPVLRSVARYYFDQDYDMRGDSIEEVMAFFKQDNPASTSIELAGELRHFLTSHPTEDDASLTREFTQTFQPDIAFYHWEGKTTRENLEFILHLVEKCGAGGPYTSAK